MTSASIVIPIFNSELTLMRALTSISSLLNGNSLDLEVVAVFDGQNITCQNLFESWANKTKLPSRIEVTEHGGVSKARNLGAQISSGRNIAFLDADDEFTEARLRYLVTDLAGKLVIGKQEIIVEGDIEYEVSIFHPSEFHLMSFVMDRRELFNIGAFSQDYSAGSEWDLAIRAKEYGILVDRVDQVFRRRYIHRNNASHQNKLVKDEHIKAIREHMKRNRLD